jgi:subtilisin family serine protease
MEPTAAFAARMAARPSRPDPFDLDPDRVWLVSGDDAVAQSLAAQPDVEWIEPVQLRSFASVSVLDSMPNDPLFRKTKQWGLWNAGPTGTYHGTLGADIHAQEAWTMSTGSNDVILSIADTGIDPNQPELGGLMPDGRARLIYPFNATVNPVEGVIDSFAHGTTVAGVMASRTNDGPHFDTLGVAGVCGGDGHGNAGCRLIPMRIPVGNSGDATSFDIARAMVWATQHGARDEPFFRRQRPEPRRARGDVLRDDARLHRGRRVGNSAFSFRTRSSIRRSTPPTASASGRRERSERQASAVLLVRAGARSRRTGRQRGPRS